jgi:CRP-like cAMP-binding protein
MGFMTGNSFALADAEACHPRGKPDMIEIMLEKIQSLPHRVKLYRKRQHLFHMGDAISSMFLIESGEARLLRRRRDGTAVVLQRAASGSFLAEASLFSVNYHCDAIATTRVQARLISRPAMRELFNQDRSFAKERAAHLAGEVRNARLRAEILSLKTVAERLDAWLADRGHLPQKGNWKTIAQEIGVSPEALYRKLARQRELENRAPRVRLPLHP